MPLYDFQCDVCQSSFTIRASFKEKETGLEPECPQCHSKRIRQVITAGLFMRDRGGASSGSPICGPNAGPGCCQ